MPPGPWAITSSTASQATLRKQLSHGVSFQAAYTFSRAFTTQNGPGHGPNLGNPLDLRQQYGLNAQYRPHRMIINYSWDLPGNNLKSVAGKVVGGWTLAGITAIQSGQWMSIYDQRGGGIYGMASATAVVISRAQMAPGMTYANLVTPGAVQDRLGGLSGGPGYVNRAALVPLTCALASGVPTAGSICAVAPDGTVTNGTPWGNSGIGVMEGPGELNFDTTVMKNFRVRENANIQFRAEFFNLFNHPQFGNPQTGGGLVPTPFVNNLAAGNFGQITNLSVNPRLIQFALKYIF